MAPTLRSRRISAPPENLVAQPAASSAIDNDNNDDSMEVDEPQLRIKTNDGKRFTLSQFEVSCFNALKILMEANRDSPSAALEYITLPSVDSEMLSKVLDWCRVHGTHEPIKHDRYAICPANIQLELTDWDKQFIKAMTHEQLLKLMHVASYLDVRSLFDACCQFVANIWEGKTVNEIRDMYGIENDYTSVEEAAILQDNKKMGLRD